MIAFKIDGKEKYLPNEWPELKRHQVLAIAPFLYANPNDPKIKRAVQQILFPMGPRLIKRFEPEDLFRLREVCNWVWEKPIEQSTVQEFTHKGVVYHLPEANFDNLGLFEFAMADFYLRQFTRKEKPDLAALDLLVATLCRPAKKDLNELDPEWNGDRREKYNSKLAEKRAKALDKLPVPVKIVVLQQFIAGLKAIHARYKEVYEQPDKGKGSGRKGPDFGYLGLIDDLAEQGIFGDWEKAAFTNIHLAFFHLRKKYYDIKELQRK